jgi:hypothetical protein
MFTYCVVTRGREDYLNETLVSLSKAILSDDVQVIIVNNGCKQNIATLLDSWCKEFGDRVHYVEFESNDTSQTRIWAALRKYEIDWITFPGDDDVIQPDFLETARDLISNNPGISAIASSMRIIDSSGKATGQIRLPSKFEGDAVAYMARALHEPPFLWPSLFFKVASIPKNIPPSRFAIDWWFSLNLSCTGLIATSGITSVDYRVHDVQESALAPSRRKYFEASIIISRFIESDEFENFLSGLSDDEKLKFWRNLQLTRPVYGDEEFGSILMFSLALKLADRVSDKSHMVEILGSLARDCGVLLRTGETKPLLRFGADTSYLASANFALEVVEGSCAVIVDIAEINSSANLRVSTNYRIGCRHSVVPVDYSLDCSATGNSAGDRLDQLIVMITTDLEAKGLLSFKITPIERHFVNTFRWAKQKFPQRMVGKLKKSFTRFGDNA